MQTSCKQTQSIKSKIIAELEASPDVKRHFWTPDEQEILRRFYGVKSTARIARVLGKSLPAVHNQAQALGLKGR